ncbi:MAG: hypothetical protein N2246_00030 [Candidatus Sumerlaeia bacterium]|nr:hypothetical protein [Candidatus Sumerlaeia bacterium]
MLQLKKLKTILLLSLISVGLGFVGFYLYINYRLGGDYTQDLAGLMPEDTIVYLSVNNLDALLKILSDSVYVKTWQENGAMELLIKDNKRLKKWQEKKQKYEKFLPYDSELDFISRWMSQQLVLAIIPAQTANKPGIIVASRTKIGFEEKLASFILENYPDLRLKKEHYGGRVIVQYQAEKEKRGFCYILLGRTVVLSLRSPDTQYLKKIIDTYNAGLEQSLLNSEPFHKSLLHQARTTGVVGYFKPYQAVDLLTAFKKKVDEMELKRQAELRELLRDISYGTLELQATKTQLQMLVELVGQPPLSSDTSVSDSLEHLMGMMPVAMSDSLCWLVTNLKTSWLKNIFNLLLLNQDVKKSTARKSKITEIIETLEKGYNSASIGLFIAFRNGSVNLSNLFAGLLIEPRPESANLKQLQQKIEGLLRDWQILSLLLPFSVLNESNILTIFTPPAESSTIIRSLKQTKTSALAEIAFQLATLNPRLIQPLPQNLNFYGEVKLKQLSEVLQNLTSLITLLKQDKTKSSDLLFWGKIIDGFQTTRIISLSDQQGLSQLFIVLAGSTEKGEK